MPQAKSYAWSPADIPGARSPNALRQQRWREAHKAEIAAGHGSRERMKRWRQRHVGVGKIAGKLKPFIGVDGEGAGVDALGRQNYLYLHCRTGLYRDGRRLSTVECLEHLLAAPAKAILVGYFFTYDATMILRDLDEKTLRRLMATKAEREADGWRSPYTYWTDYAIEFVPRQYFRVARLDPATRRVIPGSSRTVNETAGFFQKSFVAALTDRNIGTQGERDLITYQKTRRDDFSEIGTVERAYCALECKLLAKLMTSLRDDCREAEIAPPQWRGAGALAALLHRKNATPKGLAATRSASFEAAIRHAYYGGRFEVAAIGAIPGPVYEYDIRSAYPAAMLQLPCPVHTRWHKFKGEPPTKILGVGPFLSHVEFYHPVDTQWCGLPFRTAPQIRFDENFGGRIASSTLLWPRQGSGTYWSPELAAAQDLGAELKHHHGFYAEQCCDCRPYDWVRELYELRYKLGSQGAGYPIKLGLNALYGKLAQRSGGAPYRDMLAAGLITAIARGMVASAAAQAPQDVVMIATDAVFSMRPLGLTLGKALGEWEEIVHSNGLFIVQPGLYWAPEDGGKLKTRGIAARDVSAERPRFEAAWEAWFRDYLAEADRLPPEPPAINLEAPTFIGHRLALSRGKPHEAGKWIKGEDAERTISFDWRRKRGPASCDPAGFLQAFPYNGDPAARSQAYDPALMDDIDAWRLEHEADPDYATMISDWL